jgi:hypothetical protein
MLKFETGSDGMVYLIALRAYPREQKLFNVKQIVENNEETEKNKEQKKYMGINEAYKKSATQQRVGCEKLCRR